MSRTVFTTAAMAGFIGVLTAVAFGQQSGQKAMQGHDTSMGMMKDGSKMTKAEKIENAISAAPSSVTAKATILDWPAKEGMTPPVLRAGTNGWSCFPDRADTKGNDPMCLDETWMHWVQALLAKKNPQVTKVGIGYMMAPGGEFGSNIDPFAMKETADNQWSQHAPHVMILVPDTKALTGLTTDHKSGGPYVMFAGTPYAHIMAPTSAHVMK